MTGTMYWSWLQELYIEADYRNLISELMTGTIYWSWLQELNIEADYRNLDTLCMNEKNEDGEGIVYSDKISLHLSAFTGYILIQSKHQYR